jgi:hypothetical protein
MRLDRSIEVFLCGNYGKLTEIAATYLSLSPPNNYETLTSSLAILAKENEEREFRLVTMILS